MIVRWGLAELGPLLGELGRRVPLLVTTERLADLRVPVDSRYTGVRPHAEKAGVEGALEAARRAGTDSLVAAGGGSAIDTAKAVSARLGLPLVSVPTTYSGAEWTTGFGTRDAARGVKGGGGGARVEGIVYEPALTLGLPPAESGGTALNALAHCAEALYTRGRSAETDREALAGAALISRWLPAVLQRGDDLEARTKLLEGAMHAGASLRAGMGVGHAMAQALGGRFGLPHGAMNAVCLPGALRFNAEVAAAEIARLAEAMNVSDAVAQVEELASLAVPTRLREYGVPEVELPAVAAAAAQRAPAATNPRPASAEAILDVLHSLW